MEHMSRPEPPAAGEPPRPWEPPARGHLDRTAPPEASPSPAAPPAEPVQVEPVPEVPVPVEPVQAEPVPAEPVPVEAVPVEVRPPAIPPPPAPAAPAAAPAAPPAPPVPPLPPAPAGPPAPAVAVLGSPAHAGRRAPSYPPVPQGRPRMTDDTLAAAVVPDIVLDGAAHGALTLRTASVRGDSHRYLGEARQDSVMTAHLGEKGSGELLAVAVADGVGSQPLSHLGSQHACQRALQVLGVRAQEVFETLAAGREDLFADLARQTAAHVGDHLVERAGPRGLAPVTYSTTLRVLVVPLDPAVRTRGVFTVGDGGTALLRDGSWDLAPGEGGQEKDEGRVIDTRTAALPMSRSVSARLLDTLPGDVLVVSTDGFSSPLAGEPEMRAFLTGAWGGGAPEPADFLWQFQYRVKSYDDDRTAAVLWEGRP